MWPRMQGWQQSGEEYRQSLAVEVLEKSGCLQLSARGHSMLPTLWPGDVLTIRTQTIDQTRVGDIVLFARGGRFFVHRIVRVSRASGEFITRGDAMPQEDGSLRSDELLGSVMSVTRFRKNVPVHACSWLRRLAGLSLAYSDRLRSLVLRAHSRLANAYPDGRARKSSLRSAF
ncbi:MAG TPA: S24/S26 family peptidase [Terriglobales bacterium]|nr:S24/S26 family peptidase [Terriglobales bacterium]